MPRSGRRIAAPVVGALGLVVLVAGTFMPWLRSGRAERNSFESSGALHRLLGLRGVAGTVLSAWPAVALVCAAVVAIFAVGLRRCAAVLAMLTALDAGAVSVAVLRVDGHGFVGPAVLGPTVTLVGAAIVLAAATLTLTSAPPVRSVPRSKS